MRLQRIWCHVLAGLRSLQFRRTEVRVILQRTMNEAVGSPPPSEDPRPGRANLAAALACDSGTTLSAMEQQHKKHRNKLVG